MLLSDHSVGFENVLRDDRFLKAGVRKTLNNTSLERDIRQTGRGRCCCSKRTPYGSWAGIQPRVQSGGRIERDDVDEGQCRSSQFNSTLRIRPSKFQGNATPGASYATPSFDTARTAHGTPGHRHGFWDRHQTCTPPLSSAALSACSPLNILSSSQRLLKFDTTSPFAVLGGVCLTDKGWVGFG